FIIGGNLGGYQAARARHPAKVWWAPVHQSDKMPPLRLRGRNLTTPRDTLRLTISKVVLSVAGSDPRSQPPGTRYFFPSLLTFPRPGRWLLVATTGPSWGCFLLTVL